jgi:hypothetical protein
MHRIVVHEAGTTIVLPCGLVVEGRPHDSAAYATTARELGYGDDVLALCQDHDAAHAWLADQFGVNSFGLLHAAGVGADENIAAAEEAAVLAIQKFLRLSGGHAPWRPRD